MDVCIEAKIEKFWNFSLKIIFLGVISCEELIANDVLVKKKPGKRPKNQNLIGKPGNMVTLCNMVT
jgi:hypothetical protein